MSVEQWPGEAFRIEVDEAVLRDLHDRLQRTRFPAEQAGQDWETGTPLSYARRLRDYWLNEFDWRRWEARLNAYEQRMVAVGGQRIHVIVEPGSGGNPMPLIMTHGWPGSFVELIDVVDRLAHPELHGGRVEDAFTVIVPSLPGYGFSPAPVEPISPEDVAGVWAKLMRDQFGFERYMAYGSDWGSLVTARLALDHPDGLAGILITTPGIVPTPAADAPLTAEETDWQRRLQESLAGEIGYQAVQGTKPQSLAYGHTDSPIALACWTVEKFHGWTINGSTDDPPFDMDVLLANIMPYWVNGALAPMWLYLYLGTFTGAEPGRKARVPAAFLFAPHDMMPPPPRSWVERTYDVKRVVVAESGGHFPGLDNGAQLVSELRSFRSELMDAATWTAI